MNSKPLPLPVFPLFIYINTHFSEPENKTRLWTIKNIPSESLRSFNWPSGSGDALYKVHVWSQLRKSSLLRAAGKEVLNSKYTLTFNWNHYNGQWTEPEILCRKRLHCHFGCSVMNERLSFCPGFADAESLLTFAIAPRFPCPPWGVKATAAMPGAVIPATPALPVANPAQTAPVP